MANPLPVLIERMEKGEHRYVFRTLNEGRRSEQMMAVYRFTREGRTQKEIAGILDIPIAQVSVIQNRLFGRITDLLVEFHRNKNIELDLGKRKMRAEILGMKGMNKQSRKEFQKLYEEYRNRELFGHALECLDRLRQLAAESNYRDVSETELLKLKEEKEKLIRLQSTLFHYEIAASLLFKKYYEKGEVSLHSQEAKTFMNPPEIPGSCARAEFIYHNTRGFLFGFNQQLKDSYHEQEKAIEALYRLPDALQMRWNHLVSSYNNIVITLTEMREFQKAEGYLDILKALPEKRKAIPNRDSIYWLEHLLAIEFFYMMKSASFTRLPNLLLQLKDALNRYTFNDWYVSYFRYSASYASLLAGDPEEALKWLLSLFELPRKKVPEDIWHFAHILLILIHLEMKNYETALALLEKRKRSMGKEPVSASESLFIRFLMAYCKLPAGAERKERAAEDLKRLREILAHSEEEKKVLHYIDMDIYLEAKAKRKTFSEIYREKMKGNG